MLLFQPTLHSCFPSLVVHSRLLGSSPLGLYSFSTLLLWCAFTFVRSQGVGLALAWSVGNRQRAMLGSQRLEELIKSARIILPEVDVLQAAQSKRNSAILMNDGDDGFLFLQRKRNFV